MKPNSQLTLLNAAGLVLLICFAALLLRNSVDMSMSYDDSYNATVAKSVALGLGYSTSFERVTPFDPKITTGPTLLLPTALAIKLFGNTSWVPNLTTALIVLAMLAVVLRVASRRLNVSFGLLALCSIPPITVLTQLVDGWGRLRGDILAGELVVLGALLLPFGGQAADRSSVRNIFLAGVIFGLAILTKLLALLCVAAITLVFVADMMFRQEGRGARAPRMLLVLAAGTLIPLALLELARFISLHGLAGYLGNLQATFTANANQESLVAGRVHWLSRLKETSLATHAWLNYVGMSRHPLISGLLCLSWAGIATIGFFRATRATRCLLLAFAIAGGGLMFCFFTLFDVFFASRAQLPAMVFALAIGMATAEWARTALADSSMTPAHSYRQHLMGVPLGLMGAFALFWVVSFSAQARPEWREQRAAVTVMRDVLVSLRQSEPKATICGLGFLVPRVLEYALPGPLWFRNCEGRVDELKRAADSATYIVLESAIYAWRLQVTPVPDYAACQGQIVHKDEVFEMLRCSASPHSAMLPQAP